MTRVESELHKKVGRKGAFMMGNIRLPAQLDMSDLVIFVYAEDGCKKEFPENARFYIEPRRDTAAEDEHASSKNRPKVGIRRPER